MWTKRLVAAGLALLFVGLFAVSNATAAPPPKAPIAVEPMSVAAWECALGDLCVWEDTEGRGRRCAWTNADNNWLVTPVVCSWAGSTPVESYWNRGRSTSFRGVKLFLSAEYQNLAYCAPQGTAWNILNGGTLLRSHRWDNWVPGTCGP